MRTTLLSLLVLSGIAPAACDEEKPATTVAALTAVCVDDVTVLTDTDWLCDEPRVLECNALATPVDFIYVDVAAIEGSGGTCADADLVVSDEGPFLVGDTVVVVNDGDLELCRSTLTVVDTTPPLITPKPFELWPPNHKMVRVSPHDCLDVVDACDPDVDVWFTGAVSNEPDDDLGDGNTEGDIAVVAPDAIDLRAERSGTGTGRVYTLSWEAVDAAGNGAAGTCEVVVPHDQGGGQTDD